MRVTYLVCHRCNTYTTHSLLASAESDYKHCDGNDCFIYEAATYHFFQCEGCKVVSLNIASDFHKPYSQFGMRIYPLSPAEIRYIPSEIHWAYLEAERIKYHSYEAYSLLARKILELIAIDQGVKKGNLTRSMSILATQGKIPSMLVEAGTLIKFFGNSSAHTTERLNATHVQFIEKFLEI